jgi:hypothetical protein
MSAIADREYIQAQIRAAEEARQRLEAAATHVFGEAQGRTVLRRVADQATRRLRQENPEIFVREAD